jgi:hypothetical protein
MSDPQKERVCSGRVRCWACGDQFTMATKTTLTTPFLVTFLCSHCTEDVVCVVDPNTHNIRRAHADEIRSQSA